MQTMMDKQAARAGFGRAALWVLVAIATACGGDDDGAGPVDETCDVVVDRADCDESLRPIVFVHGTFGSGDNIAHVANLFGSNGYCQKRFVAVEYNSLGGNPQADLDALIDDIREQTGHDTVDLMGHSQGTGHCVRYLGDATRAAKVAHYVNLSGSTPIPEGVDALSISSENDLMGMTHHAEGAMQVTFEDEDHVDLASGDAAFVEIYKYLVGQDPEYTEVQCDAATIELQGIAETFGDNVRVANGRIEVYELGDDPAERGEPVVVIEGNERGEADPVELKRNTEYEFKAFDEDGAVVGYMYFGKLKRSHYLARFLAPPSNAFVAQMTTDLVVRGPGHSALVGRNMRGSFRHDLGNSLMIDGTEVLTDDNAGRTLTTVGLFMADQNEDQTSDLGAAFSAPFVKGTDVYVDATEPAWIDIAWNGESWKIPNWKSDAALISIMFH